MSNFDTDHEHDNEQLPPSRSQIKRDMEALQELGQRITELRPDQQAQVPMDDQLAQAVAEMRRISAPGARKRQLQYIGKLMRQADAEAIRQALALFDSASALHNQHFHELERWRERLLNEGNSALASYVESHPQVDVQHLRQLIRNALKERAQNKPPAQARKLFRYLREVSEQD